MLKLFEVDYDEINDEDDDDDTNVLNWYNRLGLFYNYCLQGLRPNRNDGIDVVSKDNLEIYPNLYAFSIYDCCHFVYCLSYIVYNDISSSFIVHNCSSIFYRITYIIYIHYHIYSYIYKSSYFFRHCHHHLFFNIFY